MDVNKVLSDAADGGEAIRELNDFVKATYELEVLCGSLREAVKSLLKDDSVPLAGFLDTKESQDAFRLLISIRTELVMTKLCIYDYMRKHRTRCAYCGDKTDNGHGWCGACDPTRD